MQASSGELSYLRGDKGIGNANSVPRGRRYDVSRSKLSMVSTYRGNYSYGSYESYA